MATAAVIQVAIQMNRLAEHDRIDLETASIAEQDELLKRAETLIARLRKAGIVVLDPSDPGLHQRLDHFFLAVINPEPPEYTDEWPNQKS